MSWATKEDLCKRFGQEFVDKLARRRDYDRASETYVEDDSCTRMNEVIDLALQDAKDWMMWKISCCFPIKTFNELILAGETFSFIKRAHIKMTIAILKEGGDCPACEECKDDFSSFCACKKLCSDNGECIIAISKSKFAIEETSPSCWPENLCCGCADTGCCCG